MSIMYLILVTLLDVSSQLMSTPDMHDLPVITHSSSAELMSMAQQLRPRHAKLAKLASRSAITTMPCTLKFMSGLTVTLINLGGLRHQSKLRLPRISLLT